MLMLFASSLFGQNSATSELYKEISVPLNKNSVFLSNRGKVILDSVARLAKKNNAYRIEVESYGQASEKEIQLGWDKTVSVIKYLKDKGIDSARFNFIFATEGGNPTVVNVSLVTWSSESWYPAPIPCYSYHRLTRKRCKEVH
jgi:hypothetical protein